MVRVSDAMVDAIRRSFGKSTGFCEVYIPTLCATSGLACKPMPAEVFGTFGYNPKISPDEMAKLSTSPNNLLYHPVKNGAHDKLLNRCVFTPSRLATHGRPATPKNV